MHLKDVRKIITLQTKWVTLGQKIEQLKLERQEIATTLQEIGIRDMTVDDLKRLQVRKEDELRTLQLMTDHLSRAMSAKIPSAPVAPGQGSLSATVRAAGKPKPKPVPKVQHVPPPDPAPAPTQEQAATGALVNTPWEDLAGDLVQQIEQDDKKKEQEDQQNAMQ